MVDNLFSVGDTVETTAPFEIDYYDCLSFEEKASRVETKFHVPTGSRGVVTSPAHDINGSVRYAVRFDNAPNWRCLYYSNASMGVEEHEIGPGHYISPKILRRTEAWEINKDAIPDMEDLFM